ncbi:(2Fe-2S) ferredoxin domain-containing protein [Candidatus Uhrbacteria bacterium]|nr:(2Fe-2S) ferredoxin domain-containing protein [Candidatus Uhrbacteria bacterium]
MKKIAVCHGKSCGPAGSALIRERLDKEYANKGIDVVVRDCCGRCEHSVSIQVDDDVIISDLAPASIGNRFIDDPDAAIMQAQQEQTKAIEKLDAALNDELV